MNALRRHCVAEPPARHRERLRKSINDDGAFFHPRHRVNRFVFAIEEDARVNFVGDDPEVVLHRERSDLLQRVFAEHGSGRVVRRIENQRFRTRRDFRRDLRNVRLKLILLFEVKRHRFAAEPARERRIDRKARVGIQNFVAGFDQRHHRERKRHLAARRDQNFLSRNVEVPRALEISRDRFAQRRDSARRNVTIAPFGNRRAHRIDHRRRRMKIGLTKLEMNDRAALFFELFRARKNRQRAFAVQL